MIRIKWNSTKISAPFRFLAITAISLVVWEFFLPKLGHSLPGDPSLPGGQSIPTTAPDPAYRIYNSSGYSLVFPPHWETFQFNHPDGESYIYGRPQSGSRIPRRYTAGISVFRHGTGEKLEDFKRSPWRPTRFQNQVAYGKVDHVGTATKTRRFEYYLSFERAGVWFGLRYALPGSYDQLPPNVRPYLDTFRSGPPSPAISGSS